METAPTSIEVLLRPTQSQSDEPSDLRGSLSLTSVYSTWQSQAVTHPIMNRARRCLTSVIEHKPLSERRVLYAISCKISEIVRKTKIVDWQPFWIFYCEICHGFPLYETLHFVLYSWSSHFAFLKLLNGHFEINGNFFLERANEHFFISGHSN